MNITFPTPVCTKQKFSEISGLTIGAIEAQIFKRQIPTRKIGRHRMIDLVALATNDNAFFEKNDFKVSASTEPLHRARRSTLQV